MPVLQGRQFKAGEPELSLSLISSVCIGSLLGSAGPFSEKIPYMSEDCFGRTEKVNGGVPGLDRLGRVDALVVPGPG